MLRRKPAFFVLILLLCINFSGCGAKGSPQPTSEPPKKKAFTINSQIPADVEYVKDVEFGKVGSRSLKMNIVRPRVQSAKTLPVIVWVHGGGWNSGSREDFIEVFSGFAQVGYLFASIEYRLSTEASFPAQIEDTKCAIRFLRAKAGDYGINPERIGIWGASAGGYLAAFAGVTGNTGEFEGTGGWPGFSSKVQAVCDWFGPADFTGSDGEAVNLIKLLLGGSPFTNRELARKASVTTYITGDDPPFFIMHGDNDTIVPLSQSQILYDTLKGAGVEANLQVVKGAGHGFAGVQDFEAVRDFFDRHLFK